eukprot:TRINITY_DN31062_c0_g1_i1.p1 TRINITY_DN31062_c0_g1~~TRINITY_DN31062_c0_g1_i1.p1  ORF type:complete len:440 (-),score=49.93 TRINITY_DN31062_c0_g1_i1:209-1528(-)
MDVAFDDPFRIATLLRFPKMREDVCKKHFKEFDSNGKGQLEESELGELVRNVCVSMRVNVPSVSALHACFVTFDKSGSKGLTAEEFSLFFAHLLRNNLPLMEQVRNPRGGGKQKQHVDDKREKSLFHDVQVDVQYLALSSVLDGVNICITDLGGDTVWGPQAVDRSEQEDVLRSQVARAKAIHPATVLLVYEGTLLEPGGALPTLDAYQDEMILTYVQASVQTMIMEADLEMKEVERSIRQEAFEPFAWSRSRAPFIMQTLEAMALQADPGDQSALSIATKCLTCGLNNTVGIPNRVTWMAAHVLPKFAECGNDAVVSLLRAWIRHRSVGFGSNSYFEDLDAATISEVLRVVPVLVPKRHEGICRVLHTTALKLLEDNCDWLGDAMYHTLIALLDGKPMRGTSRKRGKGWSEAWQAKGYWFPQSEDEEEDWMEDYLYRR